jgi:hypothetical protein
MLPSKDGCNAIPLVTNGVFDMPPREKRKAAKQKRRAKRQQRSSDNRPRCGLCGATEGLTRTPCCDNWICDDEDEYQLFSYERNSCFRNHRRYTLCGGHYEEGHHGDWQTCEKCRSSQEPEMYAHFGTNEYNFTKLKNPPKYEPTKCAKCGSVIVLADGGYSHSRDGYTCYHCLVKQDPSIRKLISG